MPFMMNRPPSLHSRARIGPSHGLGSLPFRAIASVSRRPFLPCRSSLPPMPVVPSSHAGRPFLPCRSSLPPMPVVPSSHAGRPFPPRVHPSLAPPRISALVPSPRAHHRMTQPTRPFLPCAVVPFPLSSLPPTWPIPQGS
ncbi:unnamed protein product [Closterium sp. NIES-65]|nr:unnamed protein product [Closterium sp. NIES-65]